MKRLTGLVLLAPLLVASGCVTTEESTLPGRKPDLQEAARLNTQLGVDYMRKGQLDLAQEKLEKALEQDRRLDIAHSSIAFLFAQRGDHKKAKHHYREALKLNSDDPVTQNNFGVFLCSRGELKDAEKYFMEAARSTRNPNPADAWANAGVCQSRNDPDKAEQYFREALRLNPRHANALAQMASLTFQKKDYLRARGFIQRYEAVSAPTAETLWIAAQTERQLGDITAARSYERRLKNSFPDSPETYELIRKSSTQ
jgi:type IV pilus assembly protein PilF